MSDIPDPDRMRAIAKAAPTFQTILCAGADTIEQQALELQGNRRTLDDQHAEIESQSHEIAKYELDTLELVAERDALIKAIWGQSDCEHSVEESVEEAKRNQANDDVLVKLHDTNKQQAAEIKRLRESLQRIKDIRATHGVILVPIRREDAVIEIARQALETEASDE